MQSTFWLTLYRGLTCLVAQMVKDLPAMWVTQVPPLGREDPLENVWQSVQYPCLENPHGQRCLAGCGPWGRKELDTTEQLSTAQHSTDQIRSVAQSCPTLCDPMNRSMPGLPVHHQLPEFTETHVHQVSDAIQPSHPLSSPSPLAPNPSQHQSLFQ